MATASHYQAHWQARLEREPNKCVGLKLEIRGFDLTTQSPGFPFTWFLSVYTFISFHFPHRPEHNPKAKQFINITNSLTRNMTDDRKEVLAGNSKGLIYR